MANGNMANGNIANGYSLVMIAVTAFTLALPLTGCKIGGEGKMDTDAKKASYALGLEAGAKAKQIGLDVDTDAMEVGIKDSKEGKEPRIPREEIMGAIMKLQEVGSQKTKKEGDDFLAKNKEKPGVKATASGLQYEVVTEGKGDTPKDGDTVKVHYTGTLLNGTKFDSSVDRGQPAEFQLGQIIKGWDEALKMMKVGSKWKLAIPSDLAYGSKGAGPIPPGSVLLFDVELLEAKKTAAAPPVDMGAAAGKGKKKKM